MILMNHCKMIWRDFSEGNDMSDLIWEASEGLHGLHIFGVALLGFTDGTGNGMEKDISSSRA